MRRNSLLGHQTIQKSVLYLLDFLRQISVGDLSVLFTLNGHSDLIMRHVLTAHTAFRFASAEPQGPTAKGIFGEGGFPIQLKSTNSVHIAGTPPLSPPLQEASGVVRL